MRGGIYHRESGESCRDLDLVTLHRCIPRALLHWLKSVQDSILLIERGDGLQAKRYGKVGSAADKEQGAGLWKGHGLQGIRPKLRDEGKNAGDEAEEQLDVAQPVILWEALVLECLRNFAVPYRLSAQRETFWLAGGVWALPTWTTASSRRPLVVAVSPGLALLTALEAGARKQAKGQARTVRIFMHDSCMRCSAVCDTQPWREPPVDSPAPCPGPIRKTVPKRNSMAGKQSKQGGMHSLPRPSLLHSAIHDWHVIWVLPLPHAPAAFRTCFMCFGELLGCKSKSAAAEGFPHMVHQPPGHPQQACCLTSLDARLPRLLPLAQPTASTQLGRARLSDQRVSSHTLNFRSECVLAVSGESLGRQNFGTRRISSGTAVGVGDGHTTAWLGSQLGSALCCAMTRCQHLAVFLASCGLPGQWWSRVVPAVETDRVCSFFVPWPGLALPARPASAA